MRRYLVPIVIFFTIVSAIILFFVNSNWFLRESVPQLLAEYVKPLKLRSLRVGKKEYELPNTLILHDVNFSLQEPWTQIDFSIKKVIIHNLLDTVKKQRKFRVDIQDLSMDGREFNLERVSMKFLLQGDEKEIHRAEGVFNGEKINFGLYHVEQPTGRMNMDTKKIEFLDIAGKAYGGDIKGQILIDRGTVRSYIVWAELAHLKSEPLKEINTSLFSHIHGELSGTFRMKNNSQFIEFITAEIFFDKGGEMDSSLINRIFSQSASLNKTGPIELITQGRESLLFDNGNFYLQNIGQEKAVVGVELKNTSEDLNIRALHEIPTPRGIDDFILEDIKTNIFGEHP